MPPQPQLKPAPPQPAPEPGYIGPPTAGPPGQPGPPTAGPPPPVAAGGPPATIPPQPNPTQPQLPTDFQGANAQVLGGYFLDSGNPYLESGVLDPMRRRALDTYNQQRAGLDEAASAGGGAAFGGDMYQNLAARMYAQHQQQVGEQENAVLAGQHQFERGNMMQALGLQEGFETSGLDRASQELMSAAQNATSIDITQIGAAAQIRAAEIAAKTQRDIQSSSDGARIAAANIQASLQRDLQSGQLDFSRQRLALDAMSSLSRNNLAEASFLASLASQQYAQDAGMLGIAGGQASEWGQQQLAGFGQAPGLEAAGYTGFNQAFGAEQTVGAADARAAAQRAAIQNQNAQARWNYDRYNGQGAYDTYLRSLLSIGSAGGTSSVEGMQAGTPAGPQQNPWIQGIGQGIATYGGLGGFQGGGGGGGAPAAAPPPMGAPPPWASGPQ